MSEVKPRSAFSPVTMLVLVAVAIFSFAAFITLSAFEPELNSGRNGGGHALSQSAVGFAAIVKLAQETGEWVTINRGNRGPAPPTLAVLTPQHALTMEDLNRIPAQNVLVILPKWFVGPHPLHRGWVVRGGAMPEGASIEPLSTLAPKASLTRHSGQQRPLFAFDPNNAAQKGFEPIHAGAITNLQTISGPGIVPYVRDENGAIIVGSIALANNRTLYVLADPDLMNTQGVADIDNARAGLALLTSLTPQDEEIMFDVTLNGLGRARNLLRLAFEPPFLAATLAFAAAALLLAWRGAVRVGPGVRTVRAIALGKAALADNSAALIRLTHREQRMGAGYAALTGAGLAELIGVSKTDADNAQLLDNVSAAQGASAKYSELAAEAAAAQTPSRMLEAAKKLHAWKEEILRAIR